ncbi:MAG: NUDIX domain-containing protein, partial [Nanoarchaeota archaeon]
MGGEKVANKKTLTKVKIMNIPYNAEDLQHHDALGAVIQNKDGEILMQEHVKYGFWTLPVGKVKEGQHIADALREELFEECDLVAERWKEIAAKDYDYIRDGKDVKVSGHVFEILVYSGTIKNKEPHKHTKQIFLSLGKIKQLPHVSDLTLLYLETIGIAREKH